MLPAKIKGLNQDTSDESNDEEEENPITKEALEQQTQQGYRDALVLQRQNKLPEAEKLLRELLQSDVLFQANGRVKYNNGKLQPSTFHLKYCCYLNLGNILFKMKNFEGALDFYLKATELDDTDLNLWYRIGNVAMKISNLTFAVSAFIETLLRNPNHWPSLDSIITATYAVGDYMSALLYISQGLKLDPSYTKGIVLKERIFKEYPVWAQDFKVFYPEHKLESDGSVDAAEAEKIFQSIEKLKSRDPALSKNLFGTGTECTSSRSLLKPLKNRSWLCLGKSLLKLYHHLYHSDSNMTFFNNINIKTVQDKDSPKESKTDIPATMTEEVPMEVDNSLNVVAKAADVITQQSEDEDDDVLTELVSVPKVNEPEKDTNDAGCKSKRRKCSPTLADQLKMCDKRRSTRNKTVLKSNEPSLSKTLKNLIPPYLLPEKDKISKSDSYDFVRWNEDSFDTMDIYRLLFEHQDQNNLPSHPVNELSEQTRTKLLLEEAYFGTKKERTDIDWYIQINNDQTILELLEAYARELASKWNYTWPVKLADIFVEMFEILKKHSFECDRIKLIENCNTTSEFDEESIKLLLEKTNVFLLYGELLLNQCLDDPNKEQPLGACIFGGKFSSLLLGDIHDACSMLNAGEKGIKLWMRACWLETLLFLQKKDTFAACSALSMLIEEIPDPNLEVRLPNMKQFHLISLTGGKRLLNTLHRNQNLNEVKLLFAEKQFDRIIEILQDTLKPDCQELMYLPNENTLSRYQQYNILFSALLESKKYEELFKWCEIGCYEAFIIYRKSFFDDIETDMKSKWANLVMNTLSGMLSCMKILGPSIVDALKPEHVSRLVQTLSNLVCHQIEATEPSAEITTDVVTAWILLANIVDYNEKKQGVGNSSHENAEVCILPSVSLLLVAHEHLGKRVWCCLDDGALLFYTLNVIEPLYHKCVAFSETWVTICQHIDQIFYCLYSHPFKRNKARHVQEHNSLGLALTWNRAVQAFRFYRPLTLPMYDASSKNCTITADTETLFKRMVAVIPEEQNPDRFMEAMNQYMNGFSEVIPQNEKKLQPEVTDVFYLLGDYYFQNKIMDKAIKYYSWDVCVNANRVDSWAGMALARGSQLEIKLNSCETLTNESKILKKAELTDKCFKTALQLDFYQPNLWIEYGVFCYGIHGFCSRLLKQETTNLSLQMFDMVENKKNRFLTTSFKSFDCANEAWLELQSKGEELQDERWLHHYMQGKIAEKEEKISVYLNHYYQASKLLEENEAQYPMRILYSSPPHYSVEAFEIYYRIHASILKLLEIHEERPLDNPTIDILQKFMNKIAEGSFAKARENAFKSTETVKCNEKNETIIKETAVKDDSHIDNVVVEVKTILDEIVGKVVAHLNSSSVSKRRVDESSSEEQVSCKKSKNDTESTIANETEAKQSLDDVPFLMEVEEESVTAAADERIEINDPSGTPSLKSSSIGSSSQSPSSDTGSSSSGESEETADEVADSAAAGDETRPSWPEVRKSLADNCIRALEECIRRFPEHYKSFYRLSHHYFRSKVDRDIVKARKLLVDEGGLFADRTSKNFFNNIWRITSAEIDRSGSFAFHMSRSIHLLIDILRDTQDYKTLLQLSNQLRCKPDLDKKYLRDNEREQICKESLTLSAATLRKIIENTSPMESVENKQKLLLDVYECYNRVSKNLSQKDAPFGKLLVSAFYKYTSRKDKVSLDQIVSFCKSISGASRTMPSFMDHSDVGKALTQVISLALNDSKSPLLNYSAAAPIKSHSPAMPKSSVETKPSYPIPSNLKNLPPAISVTTVQKPKMSNQSTWNRNLGLAVGPRAPTAIKNALGKDKAKPKPDPSKSRVAPKLSRSFTKSTASKEKTSKSNKADLKLDKGLSIIPVLKESKITSISLPKPATIKVVASKPKPLPDMVTVGKERPSLVITPVDFKNQPTLQQKLAARQLANTARSSPGSGSTKSTKTAGNKASCSFDLARSLGSSGVSIFPLPVDSGAPRYSGTQLSMQPYGQHSLFAPNTSGKFPAHVTVSTTAKAKPKKPDLLDINRLKAFNRGLIIEQAPRRRVPDEKLKHTLKALEESPGIIITPKITKQLEMEVVPGE